MTFWITGIIALGLAVVALVGSLPTSATSAKSVLPASRAHAATSVHLARSRPVRLEIPSLGISTSVVLLGLLPNHQVMVPSSVHTVGWFRLGPTPGQVGSSVILGHVDSHVGPGVFFRLKTLRAGAAVSVVLKDGVTARFVVTRVVSYSKTSFPDRLVYGSHGSALLNLVTCGGVFDRVSGHYESNIVVFTRLVGVGRPRVAG